MQVTVIIQDGTKRVAVNVDSDTGWPLDKRDALMAATDAALDGWARLHTQA